MSSTKSIQVALVENVLTTPKADPVLLSKFLQEAEQNKDALSKLFDNLYDQHAPYLKKYLTAAVETQLTTNTSFFKPLINQELQEAAKKALDQKTNPGEEPTNKNAPVPKGPRG